ncbi:MAG: hypothetical protein HYY96_07965 [Candidatus Tectomicrobia bacterium]|nr:hypothetical protein [Candidatus Tectomicrobia bacterium]
MTEQTYDLHAFARDARHALARQRQEDAARRIKEHLESFLRHPSLVETYVKGEHIPTGNVIYKDPDFGFMVLVHFFPKPMKSPPHDHGPCWVCYGVYRQSTDMGVYRRRDDGSRPEYCDLEESEHFTLLEGQARAFLPYDIHHIQQHQPGAVVVRVTGRDLELVERRTFQPDSHRVIITRPRERSWEDGGNGSATPDAAPRQAAS